MSRLFPFFHGSPCMYFYFTYLELPVLGFFPCSPCRRFL
uniref:Uncharacterized protein n=1 Tax=Rhizophora mucronata TaxID=61149 RepID=A0A2P2PTQ8_RHIMU